ncbi:MAG TPA: metallophosphoesterase [Nitrospiraceae bacterium]|nr:metallophosphoesterase [Nitrospiraceae bacterium]
MSKPGSRRRRRVRDTIGHLLSGFSSRLFSRFPQHFDYGLDTPTLTRIQCVHAPLAGRRAVHISDLHLDRYYPRHDAILKTIAHVNPDWIFITGDLLTVPQGLPHLFRFLSGLRTLAPVYVTLGNHDHASGVPLDCFLAWADRHKIHLLINQVMFLPMVSGELSIVGLDDPATHRADPQCIPSRVPGRFTVLLAHAPNVLDLLDPAHAVDLILCGHSHGGQWRIPGIRPFWLPYGCEGRLLGHYVENGRKLYVNRGIGWSLLPIRVNCPPEIAVIEWREKIEGCQLDNLDNPH